ncbi:MAG: chemotaxis protein CheW [Candidatus Electrothrix sp. YB6]
MIRRDVSDTLVFSPDLAALLTTIDREVAEAMQAQGPGPTAAADDERREIGRHICFSLAGTQLAVPLALVTEAGELEQVQPLPFLPAWVKGVTNLRGEIVSVTDLAAFFGLSVPGTRRKRMFIVLHNSDGMKTAMLVDRITGTRLLYSAEDSDSGVKTLKTQAAASDRSVPAEFMAGSAVFLADEDVEDIGLLDGERLLSALQI